MCPSGVPARRGSPPRHLLPATTSAPPGGCHPRCPSSAKTPWLTLFPRTARQTKRTLSGFRKGVKDENETRAGMPLAPGFVSGFSQLRSTAGQNCSWRIPETVRVLHPRGAEQRDEVSRVPPRPWRESSSVRCPHTGHAPARTSLSRVLGDQVDGHGATGHPNVTSRRPQSSRAVMPAARTRRVKPGGARPWSPRQLQPVAVTRPASLASLHLVTSAVSPQRRDEG